MTLYDEKNLHVAVTENEKQLTARSMFKRCVRVVKCRYDTSTQRTSGGTMDIKRLSKEAFICYPRYSCWMKLNHALNQKTKRPLDNFVFSCLRNLLCRTYERNAFYQTFRTNCHIINQHHRTIFLAIRHSTYNHSTH